MKVLITGGAGFLGINMIRHLLGKGNSDIVSVDISPFNYPERHLITEMQGDIRDRAFIDRAMRGVDIVIHAAAALPLYSARDIESTDIDGTRNVIECAFGDGAQRVICISSTAVYGVPDHHPLVEEDRLDGVGPYGKAKIKAEEVCLEFRRRGRCVPILRPKSFVGPERLGVFAMLFDWAKDGRNFPLLGKGNNRYQLLDVEDLCLAIWLAMTLPEDVVNDTFNIGSKTFTTMKEDYQAVLDEAGFGKRIVSLPARPAILGLRILEFLHLSPLYSWVYETASKDSFVSIEKAERKLGFRPTHSNQEALLRNFKWYMSNLNSVASRTGVNHRVPWKQGVLSVVKRFF